MRALSWLGIFVVAYVLGLPGSSWANDEATSPYAAWENGPSTSPDFFPIAVWLQQPSNAPRFQEAGINLYVGLWRGPTREQLEQLKQHGMPVICQQNRVGLEHKDDPIIVGWMHDDEPDNAQSLGRGQGYGPPILPEKIVADYQQMREADPTRPVFLNLGQGVAWDNYIGRGVRRNRPEDYPQYIQGTDIVSFDIYPAVHKHPDVAGKLGFVADGVRRLREWSQDQKVVWNCIECTHISNPDAKATPQQVKAEVWMSLVRGSRGLIYFVHQFEPRFIEAGLLADPEMFAAVRDINQQIQALASVLNSPSVDNLVTVNTNDATVPVEALVKRHQGDTYVFAVAMREGNVTATFSLDNLKAGTKVQVMGEDRDIAAMNGTFRDDFGPWGVHLYRIPGDDVRDPTDRR